MEDVLLVIAAGGALFNSWQIARLAGRVDAMEKTQNVHVNTPGLHGAALAAAPPEKTG